MEHKDKILSKRTAFEAQMTVLNIQNPVGKKLEESVNSDFFLPISSKTSTIPEPEIRLRKGEL
jgi:hypothetical protein